MKRILAKGLTLIALISGENASGTNLAVCPDVEIPDASLSALLSVKSDKAKQKPIYETFKNAPRIFLTLFLVEPLRSQRLEAILKEGDDPNSCGPGGMTPLTLLASIGDWNSAELLFKYGANPNSPTTVSGQNALSSAISAGKFAFAHQLIRVGADVHAKSEGGITPLIDLAVVVVNRSTASTDDMLWLGQVLVDQGVPINAQTTTGTTALMMAALMNNAELVRAFISWGADVNLRDKQGKSALSFAKMKGYSDIVTLLVDAGAKEF